MAGVAIRNGKSPDYGGGISNRGALTVSNSTLSDNYVNAGYGGGI